MGSYIYLLKAGGVGTDGRLSDCFRADEMEPKIKSVKRKAESMMMPTNSPPLVLGHV